MGVKWSLLLLYLLYDSFAEYVRYSREAYRQAVAFKLSEPAKVGFRLVFKKKQKSGKVQNVFFRF